MAITAFDKKGDQLVAATVERGKLISLNYYTFSEMLELMLADPKRLYVCEHSHATTKRFSKSQFWFPADIQRLLDAGVELRVVAEAVTNRKLYEYRDAAAAAGFPIPDNQKGWHEKDEAVAIALACHAEAVGHHTLAKLKLFQGEYDPLQGWAHEQIESINTIWEILRNYADWDPAALADYDGLPEDQVFIAQLEGSYGRMCDWLDDGGWQDLPCADAFCDILLNGKRPTPAVLRDARKRVAAIWYTLVDHTGQRRLFKGKPLGINNTMRHLLSMKEFHRRSGSHRAQVYWHSLRGVIRREQGCTSPEAYSKFTSEDWAVHTEQKRRFRQLVKTMLEDIARTVAT